jgi:hypothetical protein
MLMAYYIIHAGLGFWAGLGLGMLDCADMTLAASRTLGPLSIFFEVFCSFFPSTFGSFHYIQTRAWGGVENADPLKRKTLFSHHGIDRSSKPHCC